MDDFPRTFSPESSAADAGKWIGRVVIAVILAEGIWGFIVSVTNNLVLPLLARTMGGDVQSPLYLGKGDFNVPALFTSVLELCFAGIVAVILNAWVQRKPRMTRSKSVRVNPNSSAARRSTALASVGCARSSRRFSGATGQGDSDSAGSCVIDSTISVVRPNLVAARTIATTGSSTFASVG